MADLVWQKGTGHDRFDPMVESIRHWKQSDYLFCKFMFLRSRNTPTGDSMRALAVLGEANAAFTRSNRLARLSARQLDECL